MEKEKDKQKKRNKIIIILIIILLLLLLLIKLYFEFRVERERLAEFQAQADQKVAIDQEAESRRCLIDSLCNVYPEECDRFERFGNVGNLMNYADSLFERQKLMSQLDSICATDAINCVKCRNFIDLDDLRRCMDSLRNSQINDKNREQEITDSINRENEQRKQHKKATADSIEQEIADNINREKLRADSIAKANEKDCKDTVAPWIYPEPTGGLYFEPIKVSFFVSKSNVSVFYRRGKDTEFRLWDGEIISITQDTELFYYALDSCENKFEVQKKVYEFREKRAQTDCPEGMTFVESPQGNFCIDQFEWGNKRGVRPINMVSQAQARDSCISVGKRLCTAEEWTTACKGPYNWNFPYGNIYIPRACVTQDTTFRRSGEAGECRGWYAIYDMTGNLAEWTSTRAPQNNRFFIVKGGFWESGAAATCEMARYSYYPQNQHTPIGFRCCKSLE